MQQKGTLKISFACIKVYFYCKLHHYNKKTINFKLDNEKHI